MGKNVVCNCNDYNDNNDDNNDKSDNNMEYYNIKDDDDEIDGVSDIKENDDYEYDKPSIKKETLRVKNFI